LLTGLLTACTTVEFEGSGDRIDYSPRQVVEASGPVDGTVVWGGQIVAIENYAAGTEFHVLAVPLRSTNEPRIGERSIGRFIAYYPGFLEPEDYAPGRWVTLAGELDGTVEGAVDEHPMRFPYVRTAQVHLWPRRMGR
jgi:outer membrane lipoprotein